MLSRKIVRCHETDFFAVFSYSLKALQLLLVSVFRRCFSHITDPEELRLTAELEELDVVPVCAPISAQRWAKLWVNEPQSSGST